MFVFSRYAVIAFGCASCPKITCGREGCGTEFCYHCKQLWHPNQTCDAARQQRAQSLRLRTVRSSSLSYSQESGAAGRLLFSFFSIYLVHVCQITHTLLNMSINYIQYFTTSVMMLHSSSSKWEMDHWKIVLAARNVKTVCFLLLIIIIACDNCL